MGVFHLNFRSTAPPPEGPIVIKQNLCYPKLSQIQYNMKTTLQSVQKLRDVARTHGQTNKNSKKHLFMCSLSLILRPHK